ncbi:hypothetical protein BH09ACT4_BH09ACT4_06170 [soil metagenome]
MAGSYEAATRGIPLDTDEPIRATTVDRVQQVLDDRYRDLQLPLVVVVVELDALRATGIPVDEDPSTGRVRIGGPLPPSDSEIIRAVVPVHRESDRWVAPDLIGVA